MANDYPVIFVHGLLGFGPKELGLLTYWGSAFQVDSSSLERHEASVGPLSSAHDRACELAAQIKGTVVDYGADHAADEPEGQQLESVGVRQRGEQAQRASLGRCCAAERPSEPTPVVVDLTPSLVNSLATSLRGANARRAAHRTALREVSVTMAALETIDRQGVNRPV